MSNIVRASAGILVLLGGLGIIGADAMALVWVTETHGLGWALLAFFSVLPMLFIPFMAGYGLGFLLAWGAFFGGHWITGLADLIEHERYRKEMRQ